MTGISNKQLFEDLETEIRQKTLYGESIDLRPYQLQASIESVECLLQGENVVIDLPTGTGKTMIANMVTYLWRKRRPDSRVLYVVPRRILVGQHREHAKWLAPGSFSLGIGELAMRNLGRYAARLKIYHVYMTTPMILANSVRSLATDPSVFSTVDLVIVDEFDEFLTFEYQQYGTSARFKREFLHLHQLFGDNVRFLLMSATSPLGTLSKGSKDKAVKAFSNFIVDRFDPHVVDLNEDDYADYIPTARVRVVDVFDENVKGMGLALQTETAFAFRDYTCDTGIELDTDFIYPRLDEIIYNRIRYVLTASGNWVVADRDVKALCRKLRNLLNRNNFLFEDMFYGFDWHVQKRRIVCEHELDIDDGRPKFGDVHVLLDLRTENEYRPLLRQKFEYLEEIINHRRDHKGVIFTRYTRLSDVICGELERMGISYIQIDSRVEGRKRDSHLEGFRRGSFRLLVITRGTGKRGLDLPKADFAIFYSPKASERTVWQELSRIRSNIHRTKDSYFLVYKGTREERKMHELAEQMSTSGREYEIIYHRDADLYRHLMQSSTLQ